MAEMHLSWTPWGARRFDGVPEQGTLLADDHVVWEVVSVVEFGSDSDLPGARTHELMLVSRTGPASRQRVLTSRYSAWWVYPRRFPTCSCCGEPAPCRAQLVDDITQRALRDMERFSQAARCPACSQEVAPGQPSKTFPQNLRVPMGPPVSFHIDREMCLSAAAVYERERDATPFTST